MKKIWIIVSVLGISIFALGATGLAFAQSESPQPFTDSGYGQGMMGGRGRSGGQLAFGEEGSYHEIMLASFADALGIEVDQLETRLEAGETMWEIVEAEGASWEDFITIMEQSRTAMFDQAVEDGKLNQEQAVFMNSRSQGRGFEREVGGCMGDDYSDQQVPQGRWNAP